MMAPLKRFQSWTPSDKNVLDLSMTSCPRTLYSMNRTAPPNSISNSLLDSTDRTIAFGSLYKRVEEKS